jgi:hypothetical protein
MTASTPTGLLVLAMLVGQAAGFARVPKEAADKGGDVLPSRMSYYSSYYSPYILTCAGSDSSEWKDRWGDGCDWYTTNDPGCSFYTDYGQTTNCPQSCNLKCFCPPGMVLINGECASLSAVCGPGTRWRNGKCENYACKEIRTLGTLSGSWCCDGDKTTLYFTTAWDGTGDPLDDSPAQVVQVNDVVCVPGRGHYTVVGSYSNAHTDGVDIDTGGVDVSPTDGVAVSFGACP